MLFSNILAMVGTALGSLSMVSALGSTCSSPLGGGTAAPGDPYWMQTVRHQGRSAFNGNSGYQVFRNVKDFGAKGDGRTDDTAAFNAAISQGSRCGIGCDSSTITPATVYIPSGTYVISSPIIALYFTEIIGDAKNPPTLLASSGFNGIAVIDADPYVPGGNGAQYYTNQNNFFRSVKNVVIDLRQTPATTSSTGLHWQGAQSTSLYNVVVHMSTASNTAHQGIFMENGSGGFMGDLVFNGGKYGIWVGNQQYTVRNITVNNAQSAIYGLWNWGWTFQGVTINNCQVGFDLSTGGITQSSQTVGDENIIDAVATNTPIFLRTSQDSNGKLGGALVLNNIKLNNVPVAVGVTNGRTVLAGGTTTIASWGQGNVYKGTNANPTFTQGNIPSFNKPSSIVDGSGKIYGRGQPQYAAYALSQIVSVRDQGARGDGSSDDTAALQAIFDKYAGCKIIFFDAGTYVVTDTLRIPAGTQMIGEAWATIAGRGFSDYNNPKVVVQVGTAGSSGIVEISNLNFQTIGPSAGAIIMEWNVKQSTQGSAGLWNTHLKIGGSAGSGQQRSNCPSGSNVNNACFSAFMGIHMTTSSSGYFEGTWVWNADHDLDGNGQVNLYSGRGILSESQGPTWWIGTGSEHHTFYQYFLYNAANHYMGMIQTETPYFQPSPAAPGPFPTNNNYHDPTFSNGQAAWGLRVQGSSNIAVFGAGHYSFFKGYVQDCLNSVNCQDQIVNIDSTSSVNIYGLSTVGTTSMLSVNQVGIIPQSKNTNGFAQTATVWTQ